MPNASYHHIFAILDVTQDQHPALEKAALLAAQCGATVHAFACAHLTNEQMSSFPSKGDAKAATLHRTRESVDIAIKGLNVKPLKIRKHISWNDSWYQSAIFTAARQGCDLIIKSIVYGDEKRLSIEKSDRYLLRHAGCPILLVHPNRVWKNNTIQAALDLESVDDAHMRLNLNIIRNAKFLSHANNAKISVVAALKNKINPQFLEHSEDNEGDLTERVAETFDLDKNHVKLLKGNATQILLDNCSGDLDVMVIGTSARKGLSGALIGNIAEKILSKLPCDILAVP